MSWILVAGAVVGVGAGVGSYYAGRRTGKDKTDLGPIMNAPLPSGSLIEASPGMAPDLNAAIKSQMGGPGYSSELLNRISGLSTEQMQRTLEQEQKPQFESTMSGRGLGRSTIAGGGINQLMANTLLGQQQEQARIQAENEAYRQGQRQFGIGAGQTYASADASLLQNKIAEQSRRAGIHVGMKESQEAARQANLNRAIGTGMSVFSLVGSKGLSGGGGGGQQQNPQQGFNIPPAQQYSPQLTYGGYQQSAQQAAQQPISIYNAPTSGSANQNQQIQLAQFLKKSKSSPYVTTRRA